ncbi:tyrosine-type recombinase/integrase [Streptomyces sp. NPDC053079]|uniref:tyrosine-type recombinase/integrase n=1 Tax=Streptomyces sp. NPDC053079 TaxID=3365697 RepID=UPI0037CF0540
MASIVERPKVDGSITYQVRWRDGGGRASKVETENFDTLPAAEQFRDLVNAHGQNWPHGWVRGQGFAEEPPVPGDQPLIDWALRYVSRLTGIDDRTRDDYEREIRLHLSLLSHTTHSGLVVPATVCNVTSEDVTDWVRAEQKGLPDPDDSEKWLRRKADPKSIRTRHGLLFSVFQAAIEADPPLRPKNPCKGTHLPRTDDHIEEEMCFLERDEYTRVRVEFTDPDAVDLVEWLVGSGTRWGEATALQKRDLNLNGATPTATITRAWKKAAKGESERFYLGPPKTKRGRRTLRLTPTQVVMLRRRIVGLRPEDFVFRTGQGAVWHHANFYNRRWRPAVEAAVAKGLTKRPRIHDLRHTHVAWLIAARIPLPAIQFRLGHESISTTVDRYGHLVHALDDEISIAVEAVLAVPAQQGLRVVREA